MRFSARNPRGIHADSRAPIPSHPIPSQRDKKVQAPVENLPPATPRSTRHTVYEALTYDVLNHGVFDSIADLTDAVKTACAKLRIPYTSDDVAKAIRSVGARRRLL
jgi:hypothetical protein